MKYFLGFRYGFKGYVEFLRERYWVVGLYDTFGRKIQFVGRYSISNCIFVVNTNKNSMNTFAISISNSS
jgi:hypothetical protein